MGNNAHQFQGQRRRPVSQTSAVTRPVTAETETVSYLLNWKTYKLSIGTPVEHPLSTVTPSYKAVKLGSCTRAGAYRVGRTRRPRNLFYYTYSKLECTVHNRNRELRRYWLVCLQL